MNSPTRRLNRQPPVWGATVLGAALLLATSARAADEIPLEKVTLQLRWHHQFQFAGYYMAKEKGFYREAGLDVDIRPSRPGLTPEDEVISGRADYGVGSSGLLLERQAGKPVVLLANIFQHSALALVMRQDHPGDSIHSLVGKKVMIQPVDADVITYLIKVGITTNSFKTLLHNFQLEDLFSGAVDAMTMYTTDEVWSLNKAGFPYMLFTPRSMGIDFYGDNLFTSEFQIRRRPDQVRAFREASIKGWEYAMAHPDEAIDVILQKYTNQHTREQLAFEAQEMAPLILPDVVDIGYIHPDRWHDIALTYVSLGILPDTQALNGFIHSAAPPSLPRWVNLSLLGEALFIVICLSFIIFTIRAKRRITRSEEHYRELFEKAPVGIFVTTSTGKIIAFNPALRHMLGIDPQDRLESFPFNIASSFCADSNIWAESVSRLRTEKRIEGVEGQFRRTDGAIVHAEISVRMASGDPKGEFLIEGFVVDLTERKRAEEELRRRENYLELIINNSPEMIAVASLSGVLQDVSEAGVRMYGYGSREEMIGLPLTKFFDESEQTRISHLMLRRHKEGSAGSHEYLAIRKDGSRFHVAASSELIRDSESGSHNLSLIVMDITERRRMELKVRENEAELRTIIDGMPISLVMSSLEPTPRMLYLNAWAQRVFGYTLEDVPTLKDWTQKVFPNPSYREEALHRWERALPLALQRGVNIEPMEFLYATRTGEHRHMLCNVLAVGDSMLTALVDITSLRHIEDELSDTRRKLEQTALELTEHIPVGAYTMVMKPGETFANFSFLSKKFLEITGLDAEAIRKDPMRAFTIFHSDDYEMFMRLNREAFSHKSRFYAEARILLRGETRWIAAESMPRGLPDGSTVWEGIVSDITYRKRAEEAIHALQQRESTREEQHRLVLERKLKSSLMASAVAHEINQPLATMLLTIRMAMRDQNAPCDTLKAIDHEAQRVVRTIEKMKVLLRNVETRHSRVDIAEVIQSSLIQLQEMALERGITIGQESLGEPCGIFGDSAQLQLAVTNILRNAIEAAAQSPADREKKVLIQLAHQPDYVDIIVGDSGPGWSGAEREEEGLKSTKPDGTGVGLFIVRTAMQNHHGKLIFGSSPLGGAQATLRLPRRPPE